MKYTELAEKFIEIYGGSKESIRIFEAPGRINLIGEHIDYNGGHVFPAAIDLKNVVIARPNGSENINLAVTSLPNRVSANVHSLKNYQQLIWGNYQCGIAYVLQQAGYPIIGCDLLYHGTIPYGAGLSSSASIEVVTALALATLGGIQKLDMVEIALLSQKAENQYIGVKCGIMDQFTAAMSKKDHALLLDCNTLEYKYIPLKLGEYSIVITNTNSPHKLTESKYNLRHSECRQALDIINAYGGNYSSLCAIDIDSLEKYMQFFENETLYRRAKHCVTEEARTLASVLELERGNIRAFGKILCVANQSIRYDFEATGKELDKVFDIASNFDGVIGSRMTGGGFGGCNISIVHQNAIEQFKETVEEEYLREFGYAPSFFQSNIGQGAREVTDRFTDHI